MLLKRGKLAIWGVAVLISAAVTLATVHEVQQVEKRAVAALASQGQQLLAGAVSSLNRHLLGIDVLLFNLPHRLDASVRKGAAIDPVKAGEVLATAQSGGGLIEELALASLEGDVLATSRFTEDGRAVRLPAELLERMRKGSVGDPIVVMPWLDPTTAQQELLLARVVRLGSVNRVALASIANEQLARIIMPSVPSSSITLTVEGMDNQLLASAPANVGVPGRVLPRGGFSAEHMDGRLSEGRARLTDDAALVGVRPLLYAGMKIAISAPLQEVLKPVRQSTQPMVWAALCFVIVILGSAGVMHAQFAGQLRSAAESASSRATLDRALAAMSDGFLLTDESDRVLAWNGRFLDMHPGLTEVMSPGLPFSTMLWHASTRALPAGSSEADRAAWLDRRMRQHRNGDVDYSIQVSDSEVLHISERSIPGGGIVGIYRDVTLSERKLQRAKAEAESANAAKTRFLATMSHEIRTPLNGVLGINSLLEHTPLTEEQRMYVKTIGASGRTLLALLNDILDVSRIEAGKIELESIPFDLRALVSEVVGALTPQAAAKGLTLEWTMPAGPLPELKGDPNRLRQILFNFLGNALKFTHCGRVSLEVELSTVDASRCGLQFKVTDTGIGMHREVVARLFDRFAQADSSTVRQYGGSGLGLSICQDLVRLMNGHITVSSLPGQGSVFCAQLDLDRVDAVAPAEPTIPEPAGRSLNILVAEDNEVNRLVVSTLLKHMGHRWALAADGSQAVSLASRGGWDCVLMDIHMPGMDGILATQMIRSLGGPAARVPIIALTADAMPEERRRSLDAGMADHLTKPLSKEALDAALRRLPVLETETA